MAIPRFSMLHAEKLDFQHVALKLRIGLEGKASYTMLCSLVNFFLLALVCWLLVNRYQASNKPKIDTRI